MDWADRKMVVAAVRHNGYAPRHAAGALKADREFVKEMLAYGDTNV